MAASTLIAVEESLKSASEPALPVVPEAEYLELKAAADKFMRQFSGGESKSACADLFSRYAAEKSAASSKAGEMAATLAVGEVMLKGDLGKPLKGEFVFVGSRRIGGRLLKLAYLRKHSLGPFPVVFVFNKGDKEWTISQIGFGDETAGPDFNALWVQETPSQLRQTIPEFAKILKSTDECMKGLVQGVTRPSIEALVKAYSHDATTTGSFTDGLVRVIEGRPSIGKTLGYELLGVARQSDSLCKLVYVWRFEKLHAPLCFEFYKPAETWLLWRVRLFDDATKDLTATTQSEPTK
ncbi:MAG: hypothetical protein HY301_05670 [Verrucomicrobia bacterium]|nr:hypothetical protein [Verrucomicrobiota bacterium]